MKSPTLVASIRSIPRVLSKQGQASTRASSCGLDWTDGIDSARICHALERAKMAFGRKKRTQDPPPQPVPIAPPSPPAFDVNDRIAGFSMVAIKRAISHVGLMDDRDDVETVSNALRCPRGQAERVLEELERRELAVKTEKKNQWDTTPNGHHLALHWHPPRKFTPAIDRESGTATNTGFAEVACSIWRATDDGEDMFEEAVLEVGMFGEYDHERLIEINVSQPDEYQGESAGTGLLATSIYVSPNDAKEFLRGLQLAIEKSEAELDRRKKKDARTAQQKETRRRQSDGEEK